MSLWIVTSGWQGNGMEGVIVEADDEPAAMDAAATALIAAAYVENPREWQIKHRDQQIASYRSREQFHAEKIELPYVGEFG